MSECMLTTGEVRFAFIAIGGGDRNIRMASAAEFDRWYAAEKAKWQAEALRDAADWLDSMQTREHGAVRDAPLHLHQRADRIAERP
jgi:hypothetical protein